MSHCSRDKVAAGWRKQQLLVQNWLIWEVGGGAICTRISSVACDGGGTGGDAPASSDADRGKQQLWSPTFLPITILPNYCLSEPVVVQKTYSNASISRAVMEGRGTFSNLDN